MTKKVVPIAHKRSSAEFVQGFSAGQKSVQPRLMLRIERLEDSLFAWKLFSLLSLLMAALMFIVLVWGSDTIACAIAN